MSTPYHANLELILIDWLTAQRDGDLDRLASLLDEHVEQRWIDGKVYCANREQFLAWTRERLEERPRELEIDAVEAIRGDREHVVLGAHGRHLAEVGGEHVGGHLYEVFTIRDGRVRAIHAFTDREAALRAAGSERRPAS